jgi:NitT/TauT family transport system ATP-binding protein
MLRVEHLAKTYGEGDGAVEALRDIDFEVPEQEFLCIVGPSGAGKTTLLKCMSGLLPPTSGTVTLRARWSTATG